MKKKKYEVTLNVSEIVEAKNEEEARAIFWDRFDNAVWEADFKEVK